MFSDAIEIVSAYTRPINSIMLNYGSHQILPGSATLFFVNEDGYAITCKHVAEMILASEQINETYIAFINECKGNENDPETIKKISGKYNFHDQTTIQLKTNFIDCVDKMSGFTINLHPTLDLALIKFNDFTKIHYQQCARFLKDETKLKQGKFLCRLGFPFPEFNNFHYNDYSTQIEWNQNGNHSSPRFPLEGMITRFLANNQDSLYGIEMSTPGLRGQSGGPLFDEHGIVCGMQYSTKHLHLGFDLEEKEIMVNNKIKKISDYSFIHLGQCIHANIIKAFLRENKVNFYEV